MGCREVEGAVEHCDDGVGDFYSVYLHFDPEWQDDPIGLHGVTCIADCPTFREALDFAEEQAARWLFSIKPGSSANRRVSRAAGAPD
ncbi:hypothetical protein AWM79_09850 [Pseudomonas agarici]|uniref:Uncharacterized protein n=1 Tax=Pseudomonas agarici TaxID=46677 RepID=A0A0X1T0J1_PSEAA|nr:hypothetical protein AWM79_09850 [Pseudomonas agarici]SEL65914.1 hypothetical protein SAMN05216604_12637 [Pseudomonas agarici]